MCKTKDGYSFSFMEMINSEGSGKTSATGVVGTVTCLVVLLIFCVIAGYFIFTNKDVAPELIEIARLKQDGIMDIINYCTILFGMGSALLGVRKVTGALGSKHKKCQNDNENLTEE